MWRCFEGEKSRKDLKELVTLAKQCLNAHGKKLSTKAPVAKQDLKTALSGTQKDAMRYNVCDFRAVMGTINLSVLQR